MATYGKSLTKVATAAAFVVAASGFGLRGDALAGDAASMTSAQLAVHLGHQLYVKNCGTCHGPAGKGDGIASSFFKQPPTNLTLLAKKNDGTFPVNEVLSIVNGDAPIAAHGTREMPVWSEVIGNPMRADMTGQQVANAQILTIVRYLESVQQK